MYAAAAHQFWRGQRVGRFPHKHILLFYICIFFPLAVNASPFAHPDRQQTEAFFLSFSDLDVPDFAGLIEASLVRAGVVCGSLSDLRQVARALGRGGVRILNRQKLEGIPVQTGQFQLDVFDWRQLHRWGAQTDRLPPASSLLYWEYSPWELYWWKILGLLWLLMIETLLIIVLLRSRIQLRGTEETLRRKEAELLEAQRLAQLGSWQRDAKTNAVIWSDEIYDLTGFNPDLPIRSFKELSWFFTRESWARLTQSMEEIGRSGKSYELELQASRTDGIRMWVLVREAVVRDHNGSIVRVRGTMQNITERKAIQEARLRHAAIVESSDDAIISEDLDGLILSWNSGAQRIFGFTETEVLGKPITILIPPELYGEERMIMQRVKAGERIEHYETIRVGKGGKRIYVSLTVSPMRDSTGRITGLSKIARDITENKQSQQALMESERRFRLMADSAPVLMWLSGPDRLYVDLNKEWLRFTGKAMEEQLGEGWKQSVHPDDLQACLRIYDRAFDTRRSFEAEYRMLRHDGRYRWILNHGLPRFTDDGGFAGYIGCCVDITDQKEAKTVLRELSGRLVHAQEEERARIAGELHDDINQRLALLANGLQELEQTQATLDESQRTQQLRDLERLTGEIVADLQQLSHRLHPSKLRYLGLAAAVRELCKEFSKQHKIEVECIVQDLPRHLDENVSLSLFRTAQESLHNAAKHSRAHYIKVELIGRPDAVRLRVSDDGIGFDSEGVGERHGLGLVSMRERLRLIGGEFSIWSRPSLGTQVEATVPVQSRAAQQTA